MRHSSYAYSAEDAYQLDVMTSEGAPHNEPPHLITLAGPVPVATQTQLLAETLIYFDCMS